MFQSASAELWAHLLVPSRHRPIPHKLFLGGAGNLLAAERLGPIPLTHPSDAFYCATINQPTRDWRVSHRRFL
jgi:hypothetical protein